MSLAGVGGMQEGERMCIFTVKLRENGGQE